MREILFRGKCRNEWFEGLLSRIQEQWYVKPYYSETKKVAPETVGQYTGLTDKNGKKIFEGDIVSGLFDFGDKIKSIVVFRDGAFGLLSKQHGKEHFNAFTSICNVVYEVIGNIHDNLEL